MVWKCPKCHGTGRVIVAGFAVECRACAGTGDGTVNGAEVYHRRALDEIDRADAEKAASLPASTVNAGRRL